MFIGKDFLEWLIILITESLVVVIDLAYLNLSMTVVLFRHLLTLMVFETFTIIFSRCFLLTSLNSFFAELISPHLVLFQKFSW